MSKKNYFLDRAGQWHTFDVHKQPVFKEAPNKDYVLWGMDENYLNNQPLYYDWLYNSSSKHRAIINRKCLFIQGEKLDVKSKKNQYDVETESFIFKLNDNDFVKNITLNELKYGGFCYEVIFDKAGRKIMPHYVNFGNVRRSKREYDSKGREKEPVYYYTSNWNNKPEENPDWTVFHPFDWEKSHYKNKRYLVYYNPELDLLYPLPEYTAAVPYIAADYEVGNFTYNNTKNGFTAGLFVEFYNGEPDEDQKAQVVKNWKESFHNTDESGEPVVSFLDDPDSGTKITPLAPNGQDDRFLNLNTQIREEIFSGHTVNPKVVGLKDEAGFANNADELRVAIEEFQSYYVTGKQINIERHLNAIKAFNAYNGEIYIKRLPPIQAQLSEEVILQVLTTDEIRQMMGYDNSDVEKNALADAIATLSPLVANEVLESLSLQEIRSIVGLYTDSPVERSIETRTLKYKKEKEDNLIVDHLSKCGYKLEDLEVISSKELFASSIADAEIQDYRFRVEQFGIKDVILRLLKAFGLNVGLIAKLLGVDETKVNQEVEELKETGKVNDNGEPVEDLGEVITVYSYDKRNDVSGADVLDTTRPFCRNLVTLSKTTRWDINDIKAMNNGMGLDVFASRGGWYTIPDTNTHVPYCRHIWKSHLVRLKQ